MGFQERVCLTHVQITHGVFTGPLPLHTNIVSHIYVEFEPRAQTIGAAKFDAKHTLVTSVEEEFIAKGWKIGAETKLLQAFEIEVVHGRLRTKQKAKIPKGTVGKIVGFNLAALTVEVTVVTLVGAVNKSVSLHVKREFLDPIKIVTDKPGGGSSDGPKLTTKPGLSFLNDDGGRELQVRTDLSDTERPTDHTYQARVTCTVVCSTKPCVECKTVFLPSGAVQHACIMHRLTV